MSVQACVVYERACMYGCGIGEVFVCGALHSEHAWKLMASYSDPSNQMCVLKPSNQYFEVLKVPPGFLLGEGAFPPLPLEASCPPPENSHH